VPILLKIRFPGQATIRKKLKRRKEKIVSVLKIIFIDQHDEFLFIGCYTFI